MLESDAISKSNNHNKDVNEKGDAVSQHSESNNPKRQINGIVLILIENLCDSNKVVANVVYDSLIIVTKKRPNIVLEVSYSYMKSHQLTVVSKSLIFNVIKTAFDEISVPLKTHLVNDFICLTVDEMVNSKEIVPEWQKPASELLIVFGRKIPKKVIEVLLSTCRSGVIPHFYVLQTIANLSIVNVPGVMPFMKTILGTLLPLLSKVKNERFMWLFSYAFSHFSEAIAEYTINENPPDPKITQSLFSSEISSAFDISLNVWIQCRDPQVRSQVAVSLGRMSSVLNERKLEEYVSKLIQAFLNLFKRQTDSELVVQGFCMVLQTLVNRDIPALELYIENIINALFHCIYSLPNSSSTNNYNEQLRCFGVLAVPYTNRLMEFLLGKLDNNNELVKISSLLIIKHVIYTLKRQKGPVVKISNDKILRIITAFKKISDPGNKVVVAMAQVIIALAYTEYLVHEGGFDLIRLLISYYMPPKEAQLEASISHKEIMDTCEQALLGISTIESLHSILWPHLFNLLVLKSFTGAVGIICKSLVILADREMKTVGAELVIDFSILDSVSPEILLSRLIVLIGQPFEGNNRGIAILQLLKRISPIIKKNMKSVWDAQIPILIRQLEANSPGWNQQEWEKQVQDFFIQTLAEFDKEESLELSKAFLQNLPLYVEEVNEKCILLTFLGQILKNIINRAHVIEALDLVFRHIHHHNAIERESCANLVGTCSATHLDIVLVKLDQIIKAEAKSGGLFSFIKEFKTDVDLERLRATIILCYGQIAAHAPTVILITRIETPIARSAINCFSASKEKLVKETMLKTIKLISEAANEIEKSFSFRARNELLQITKSILEEELAKNKNILTPVRYLALDALSSLMYPYLSL